jgi:NAD(P)-dependent dehydrogenase (short-subunit alcohol dehydrogenase family)
MSNKSKPTKLESTDVVTSKGCFSNAVIIPYKNLAGKIVIITGGNQGIGKETARGIAKLGATIILACRDAGRGTEAANELNVENHNNNVIFMKLDLSDLKSVKAFADEFKSKYQRLDILVNNAGVVSFGTPRSLTKDGFERHWGTNHLGHFYLTTLLLDVIKNSPSSRIINLSSMINSKGQIHWDDLNLEKKYSAIMAFSQSKLANIIFTKELQRRLEAANVKVVSVHPGVVGTDAMRDSANKWYFKVFGKLMKVVGMTPADGARTSLYCALENHEKLKSGAYYDDCKVGKANKLADDEANWIRLWDVSEKMIASKIAN